MKDRITKSLKGNEVNYKMQTLDMLIEMAEEPPTLADETVPLAARVATQNHAKGQFHSW